MNKRILTLLTTVTIALSSLITSTPVYAQDTTYEYANCVDGTVIFNEYDYQAYGLADGAKIMGEAFCGLRVATSGTTVTVTPYRHHEMYTKVKSIAYGPVNKFESTKLTTVDFNENTSFDLNGKPDGVYQITVIINDDIAVSGYVVKRENVVHTCQIVEHEDIQCVSKSLEIFHKFTDNLNPNDYLSLNGLTYPSAGGDLGYVDDVAAIAQFSKDKFSSTVWNEETKVYSIVDWLNKNIAYDTWRTQRNESRAHALHNYTDPSVFAWHNNVGVCWDYTNMLAIMCRAHGIPATSIETPTHTWNIVYINGRWVSIDVCDTGRYESATYDGDKTQWTGNRSRTWAYYMTFPMPRRASAIVSTNKQMWTRDIALGL